MLYLGKLCGRKVCLFLKNPGQHKRKHSKIIISFSILCMLTAGVLFICYFSNPKAIVARNTTIVSSDSLPEASSFPGTKAVTYDEFLAETLFIGDSRTNRMSFFEFVSEDQVLAIDGANHAAARTERFIEFADSNKKLTMAEAVERLQPARILVSFGINGIAFMGEETFFKEYQLFLDDLKKSAPHSVLVIQSILPVSLALEQEDPRMANSIIDTYNQKLKELALENDACYLDTAALLKNSDGQLDAQYDSGDGLHFNKQAYEVLFGYLKQHYFELLPQ